MTLPISKNSAVTPSNLELASLEGTAYTPQNFSVLNAIRPNSPSYEGLYFARHRDNLTSISRESLMIGFGTAVILAFLPGGLPLGGFGVASALSIGNAVDHRSRTFSTYAKGAVVAGVSYLATWTLTKGF